MEERTVKVVLGDWSDDGHGKTETLILRLRGRDLSDEALSASYQARVAELGVDLATVCQDYEDSSIAEDFYEQLQEAGFTPRHEDSMGFGPSVAVKTYSWKEDSFFPAIELLMFYTGATVEGFSWEVVREDIPLLLGGSGSILKQKSRWGDPEGLTDTTTFGYGLFF